MSKDSTPYDEPIVPRSGEDDDDSEFIGVDGKAARLDLGELFSKEFTNIRLLYCSPRGPIEIHTANRYGKRYILKGLQEPYRNDPLYTMSLAKEFEIGIQLDHPNIRRTIGFENVEGLGRVIVLEYIDGCSLKKLLASPKLSTSLGRSIAAQTAGALSYLHSKQIYHRDIKPTNILVSHNGNAVKIIDFNLSDCEDSIILKNPSGTRSYMAPELLDGDGKPTAAADIYSFGVLAGEIAEATDDEALAEAVRKCTHAKAEKRPQSIDFIKLPPAALTAADRAGRVLASRTLTYILMGVIAAAAALIILLLTDTL